MPVGCAFGANLVDSREILALSGVGYDAEYRFTIAITDQESHGVLLAHPFVSIGSAH